MSKVVSRMAVSRGCLRAIAAAVVFWVAVAAIAFMLQGCASGPQTADVQVYCLPMVGYTTEQQTELLKEFVGIKDKNPMLVMVIHDYLKMRDADKACDDARKKGNK